MAIYHLHVKVISRSSGASAIAAAAYRACEKIGEHDYTPRKNAQLEFQEIYVPNDSPDWCKNRHELWEKVEASEKRKDAQLCRELNIALPLELKESERQKLIENFSLEFVKLGMIADTTIHKSTDGQNPHAHIMLTTREVTPEGFGKKRRDWNDKKLLEGWREKWAELANIALEQAGHTARIDHRTLKAQGIDREPTIHQGKNITHAKHPTIIRQLNETFSDMARNALEIAQIRAELATLEKLPQKEQTPLRKPQTASNEAKISIPQLKTRKDLRDEDKADEKMSREFWEASQKTSPEWQADEKILAQLPDTRVTENDHRRAIMKMNTAKENLKSYEEEVSRMGKLARFTKRGKIEDTLTTLKTEKEAAEKETNAIGAILYANRALEVKKSQIHQKRRQQWDESPEGKAFKTRHEERRKEILALEKEEKTRERAKDHGWSR